MTAKAERAPMGEPDAEQIARAWWKAERERRMAREGVLIPTWDALGDENRAKLTATAQDLIDAGHIL